MVMWVMLEERPLQLYPREKQLVKQYHNSWILHLRFRSQMSFTQGSYRVLDSWKSLKIWKPIFQPAKSLENEDKLWKMVNSLECLFSFSKLHCNLILYICMSSWENVDSFFVLVSFYRFIDNALSGKESSVLEKVRWKSYVLDLKIFTNPVYSPVANSYFTLYRLVQLKSLWLWQASPWLLPVQTTSMSQKHLLSILKISLVGSNLLNRPRLCQMPWEGLLLLLSKWSRSK